MKAARWQGRIDQAVLIVAAFGIVGCIVGVFAEGARFYAAWMCAYLFWLGLPLGAVTLVLVHDLTGGAWMAAARPVLDAAIATMPLAVLAGIPVMFGIGSLFTWAGATGLTNHFYLNPGFFIGRYIADVILWNLLAAYALWLPRGLAEGIAPALSWLSGIGLLILAYTVSFAAIDWVLSLEPRFWSAIIPMIVGAGWFNNALAMVLIVVALAVPDNPGRRHLANLAATLLSTVIFWAYVEFCQFLIVWEEDISSEIPWYLHRVAGGWQGVTWLIAITGFVLPFLMLVWSPAKRSRILVITACAIVLLSRLLHTFWLLLPDIPLRPAWWLDLAAMLALGGLMLWLFRRYLRIAPRSLAWPRVGEA